MSSPLNGKSHHIASHTGGKSLNIEREKARILSEIAQWFEKVKTQMDSASESKEESMEFKSMPKDINNSLEQLQMQALIIKAAEYFSQKLGDMDWFWDSGETPGNHSHLRGKKGNMTIISVDVNPDRDVKESIILQSLEKLNKLPGEKFYIVQSDAVFQSAVNLQKEVESNINILNIDKIKN